MHFVAHCLGSSKGKQSNILRSQLSFCNHIVLCRTKKSDKISRTPNCCSAIILSCALCCSYIQSNNLCSQLLICSYIFCALCCSLSWVVQRKAIKHLALKTVVLQSYCLVHFIAHREKIKQLVLPTVALQLYFLCTLLLIVLGCLKESNQASCAHNCCSAIIFSCFVRRKAIKILSCVLQKKR